MNTTLLEEKAVQETERKPKRRDRCMFRDKRGRWWLDYYTPDGKRRRKLVGKSKKEAEKLLRTVKGSIDKGVYVDTSSSPPFSKLCETFMEQHGRMKRSYNRSQYVIERLKSFFGNTKTSKITGDHIEQYRLKRLGEKSARDPKGHVSLTTIDREVGILRAILGWAVGKKKIAINPAGEVKDYREDKKRKRFLSTEEIRKLLQATKRVDSPILRPAVYVALGTGMRKNEILKLRWNDVDFDARQILVRDPKNDDPRHVPMARGVTWLMRKLAAKNPLSEWVFQTVKRNGSEGAAGDVKTAWRHALRLARVQDFRFHDLRHTFASHYAMTGGNLYALAKILGHSNPKITLDRYAHLSPEFIQAQRGIMDAMYSNRQNRGHQMDTETVSAGKEES